MNYIIDLILQDLENKIDKQDIQYYFAGFPETNISKDLYLKGVICVRPVKTNTVAVTTGITDESLNIIEIIVAKSMQTKVYTDAQQETGEYFLARVMDGRRADGSLLSNTVRYVVRNNLKKYGSRQPEIEIVYNDKKVDIQAVVTATMTVSQEEHENQLI